MRKALAVAAGIALVVVLYGAAGTWLAPRFIHDALVDAAAEQGLTLKIAEVRSQPFALRVGLKGISLHGPQGRSFSAAQGSVDLSWASLWQRAWIVRELVVEHGTVQFAAQGLALEQLTLRARDLSTRDDAQPGSYDAAARLAGGAGQIVSRGALSLAPLALHEVLVEGNGLAWAGVELPQATLEAPKVPIPPSEPVAVSLRASVAPQGRIAAQGSFNPQSLRADLEVEFDALPLAPAQRWLPVKVASGTLSGKGELRIGKTTAYEGVAAVHGLRLEERDSGALLLALQHAETGSLKLALAPARIEIGELLARAPEGRLVIAQDGSVNFAAAVPKGDGQGEPVRIALERLRIEKGTLHFADHSLANAFEVTIRELSGSITSLGNASSEPARIRLAGRVQPYGSARIRGTIDLGAPTKLANVTANLRNLQLEAFNPYIAKFAGYRIESGRLSAQLRYALRDGRLVGNNELVFERIQLGEKLESKGRFDLPLELAVALLADAEGRIDLAIPVRGNLNDPQFDLGALTARALGNVLKKVVSAPFRAIGALFDRDRDPGAVPFDPGSALLTPPAEEGIAEVAKALEQRPRLAIQVHGGYDLTRDPEALRLLAARHALSRAAGVKGALDLSDPKVVRAAERLYLKRVGDRAGLAALRKSESRYGRALLQSLAAAMPADAAAIQALAQARAEAVRAALLDHGVDPARVRIAAEVENEAEAEGVPTELSLSADPS
ncbi:MAG TPA: DUF748 domain-containing protein [Burkholderiales bacterium]|nr:DUF748 domain-containing protein [Burkholderiales bacterium]